MSISQYRNTRLLDKINAKAVLPVKKESVVSKVKKVIKKVAKKKK